MKRIPEELSSSDEGSDADGKEGRTIRTAYRKRKTRSKQFNESLRLAKSGKMYLMDVHHVNTAKKVFEIDHGGKLRLVEIGEGCMPAYSVGNDECFKC